MRARILGLLGIVGMLLMLAVPTDSCADSADAEVYYCYGDHPSFQYLGNGSVEWHVEGIPNGGGQPAVIVDSSSEKEVTINTTDYSRISVKQTVTDADGKEYVDCKDLIPLHISANPDGDDGRFTVTFMDGADMLGTQYVDGYTMVRYGDPHVLMPADPERSGYQFGGWFTDQKCSEGSEFDPREPIPGDITVYAKWIGQGGSSGGGSHTVVVRDTYVVTFEPVNGLRYDVISTGSDSVSFSVSVTDGYEFDLSSIVVKANGNVLLPADGVYKISNIRSDVLVTIDGDRLYSVDYRLDRVSASAEGFGTPPSTAIPGELTIHLSPSFGWTSLKVTVLMDGRDVTSECLHGDTVVIDVGGNVVVIAESSVPWLYILVIAVVAVAAVAAYVWYRKRGQRS